MHMNKLASITIVVIQGIFLFGCSTTKPNVVNGAGKIDIAIGQISDSAIEILIHNETNMQLTFWDVEIRQMDSGNQKILRKHARLSCREEALIIKEGATDISPYSTYIVKWDRKDQGCNIVNPEAIQVQTWSVGHINESKIFALSHANGKQSGYLQSNVLVLRQQKQ